MDRPLRIGDLARISLPNEIQTYPVELIDGDRIYISVEPGKSSILVPVNGQYQVEGLEVRHRVEFLSSNIHSSVVESSLVGDEFLDLLLLEELDDESLETLCNVDDYTQHLCNDDQLWKNKIVETHGQSKLREKPVEMSFKEYYYYLDITPLLPYLNEDGTMQPAAVQAAIDLGSKRLFDYLYTNYRDAVDSHYDEIMPQFNYNLLKEKYPHIFQNGYARMCSTSSMPRVYTPAEQSYYEDHPEIVNGKEVPRQIYPFPPDNPELYLIVPPNNQHKFLGYKNNITNTREQYPVLPCLFRGYQGAALHPYPVGDRSVIPRTWEEVKHRLNDIWAARKGYEHSFTLDELKQIARNLELPDEGDNEEVGRVILTEYARHFNI